MRDLEGASVVLREVLGFVVERVRREQIGQRVELLRAGEVGVELIEHLHPIAAGRFREDGDDCQLHHIAVEVEDITLTIEEMASKGVQFSSSAATVSKTPNGRERSSIFTLPKTTGGVTYQLIQFH